MAEVVRKTRIILLRLRAEERLKIEQRKLLVEPRNALANRLVVNVHFESARSDT